MKYDEEDVGSYCTQEEHTRTLITLGVEEIDHRIQELRRGQLVAILGGYKAGKTWWMSHLGLRGLMEGLKVLHITHEMTQSETEMR